MQPEKEITLEVPIVLKSGQLRHSYTSKSHSATARNSATCIFSTALGHFWPRAPSTIPSDSQAWLGSGVSMEPRPCPLGAITLFWRLRVFNTVYKTRAFWSQSSNTGSLV